MKGKIQSLPPDLLLQVHRRLEGHGASGPETSATLLPWLNGLPEMQAILAEKFEGDPVNEENLSLFRRGKHKQWVDRQEKLQAHRDLAEWSVQVAQASGPDMSAGAVKIAAGRILDLLETAEGKELNGMILNLQRTRKLEQDDKKIAQKDRELAQKDISIAQAEKTVAQRTRALEQAEEKLKQAWLSIRARTASAIVKAASMPEVQTILRSGKPQSEQIDMLAVMDALFGDQLDDTPDKPDAP